MAPGDAEELAHLRNLLAARTESDGKPKKGYKGNVDMLKSMITALEAKLARVETSSGPGFQSAP